MSATGYTLTPISNVLPRSTVVYSELTRVGSHNGLYPGVVETDRRKGFCFSRLFVEQSSRLEGGLRHKGQRRLRLPTAHNETPTISSGVSFILFPLGFARAGFALVLDEPEGTALAACVAADTPLRLPTIMVLGRIGLATAAAILISTRDTTLSKYVARQ